MHTKSTKPTTESSTEEAIPQLERFKSLARELGADESPGALDRAFSRLDTKRTETKKPAKHRAKEK